MTSKYIMTREDLNKHKECILAWGEGAEIEYQNSSGNWESIFLPTWCESIKYRIKSKPKLVPFTYDDNLVGLSIINKSVIGKFLIVEQDIDRIYFGINESVLYKELFDYYTFIDGTPCGKYDK